MVVEGRVRLTSQDRVLSEVGPGEAFGTWALVDDSERGHRADCVEDGRALALHRDQFYDVAAVDLTLLQEVVRVLAKRLRALVSERPDEARVEGEGIEKPASLTDNEAPAPTRGAGACRRGARRRGGRPAGTGELRRIRAARESSADAGPAGSDRSGASVSTFRAAGRRLREVVTLARRNARAARSTSTWRGVRSRADGEAEVRAGVRETACRARRCGEKFALPRLMCRNRRVASHPGPSEARLLAGLEIAARRPLRRRYV
jgi:hypothetical protein